ncbi:MAG TPA: hypothetical protein DD733_10280 [Clostridiales bacterium]|nr:hypothetical protein [Clostridiales bacterium]
MALISIGGVALPTPTTYSVKTFDLDSENSKRTEAGSMHRDVIRAGIYKIIIGWDKLKVTDLQIIATAMRPSGFDVTFFDPTTFTTNKEIQMYAGDKESALVLAYSEEKPEETYWSFSTTLTDYADEEIE